MWAIMMENMEEKELGYSYCVNIFVTRIENYPLHKLMVHYNHDGIKGPTGG